MPVQGTKKRAKTGISKQQCTKRSPDGRPPSSHAGSTATLLDMRPNVYQGQRSFDDYTLQLAMLEEQNRQRRRQAYEQRQAMSQPSSPSNETPTSTVVGPAPTSNPESVGGGGQSKQDEPSSMDAIKQYQRMLLEEQRRRNEEMRKTSPSDSS